MNSAGHHESQDTNEQPAERRLEPARQVQAMEDRFDAIEAARVEQTNQAADHPKERVIDERGRVLEGEPRLCAKDRLPAFEQAEDAVARDGGNERRDKGLHLEVMEVQNLGCHDGAAQRCTKDGADTRAHASRHRHPPILRAQAKPGGEHGPECG